MESTLLVILLLLLLLLWLFIRRRSNRAASRPRKRANPKFAVNKKSKFHAVSLRFSSNACAAAKALQGERFLATEAPKLPLADCDAHSCECHFTHHDDRRSGKDRRNPFTASGYSASTGRFAQERRSPTDRRKRD